MEDVDKWLVRQGDLFEKLLVALSERYRSVKSVFIKDNDGKL